jgi:hypothetical protein
MEININFFENLISYLIKILDYHKNLNKNIFKVAVFILVHLD